MKLIPELQDKWYTSAWRYLTKIREPRYFYKKLENKSINGEYDHLKNKLKMFADDDNDNDNDDRLVR